MILTMCSSSKAVNFSHSFFKSQGRYSSTTARTLISQGTGLITSNILIILSLFILLRMVISLKVLRANILLAKTFLYILTAYILSVYLCLTLYTSPYDPAPTIPKLLNLQVRFWKVNPWLVLGEPCWLARVIFFKGGRLGFWLLEACIVKI